MEDLPNYKKKMIISIFSMGFYHVFAKNVQSCADNFHDLFFVREEFK